MQLHSDFCYMRRYIVCWVFTLSSAQANFDDYYFRRACVPFNMIPRDLPVEYYAPGRSNHAGMVYGRGVK